MHMLNLLWLLSKCLSSQTYGLYSSWPGRLQLHTFTDIYFLVKSFVSLYCKIVRFGSLTVSYILTALNIPSFLEMNWKYYPHWIDLTIIWYIREFWICVTWNTFLFYVQICKVHSCIISFIDCSCSLPLHKLVIVNQWHHSLYCILDS